MGEFQKSYQSFSQMGLLQRCLATFGFVSAAGACSRNGAATMSSKYPITIDESVMNRKAHGTCERPVMENLRWGSDWKTADKICCFNRHYAEHSGYFLSTKFVAETKNLNEPITFYDSVSGKPLFIHLKEEAMKSFWTNQ